MSVCYPTDSRDDKAAGGRGIECFTPKAEESGVGFAPTKEWTGRLGPEQLTYTENHRNCETVEMRNITVSVDDATYRRARIRAAELDTSVSALVRDYLESLAVRQAGGAVAESVAERRGRLLREVIADFDAQGVGLRMADNLSRDELYDRAAARAEAASERRRQSSA